MEFFRLEKNESLLGGNPSIKVFVDGLLGGFIGESDNFKITPESVEWLEKLLNKFTELALMVKETKELNAPTKL